MVKVGEQIGIKVFCGVELSYKGTDFLVYGLDKSWYLAHPEIMDMKKSDELKFMMESGALVIQAHPFRNGCTVLDTKFLDGVEINCHPMYKCSYREELTAIAFENNLRITSGGDFHADTYRPVCGMYMPDDIRDEKALKDYICTAEKITICHHEPDGEGAVDMEFEMK